MKIIRDGKEIKLTWQEIREAYELMRYEYFKEDVVARADQMGKALSDKDIEEVAKIASRGIEHNDSHWESYWMTIEYAIKNYTMEF